MKLSEFTKLKKGDKVVIKESKIERPYYVDKIDKARGTFRVDGWKEWFSYEDWEYGDWEVVKNYKTISSISIKGDKVEVVLSDGSIGWAKCGEEDRFDPYTGYLIALSRAYGKEFEVTDKEVIFKTPTNKLEPKNSIPDGTSKLVRRKGSIYLTRREEGDTFINTYTTTFITNDERNLFIKDARKLYYYQVNKKFRVSNTDIDFSKWDNFMKSKVKKEDN